MTSTLCAATFSNSYVKGRLSYVMLRFVAVPSKPFTLVWLLRKACHANHISCCRWEQLSEEWGVSAGHARGLPVPAQGMPRRRLVSPSGALFETGSPSWWLCCQIGEVTWYTIRPAVSWGFCVIQEVGLFS